MHQKHPPAKVAISVFVYAERPGETGNISNIKMNPFRILIISYLLIDFICGARNSGIRAICAKSRKCRIFGKSRENLLYNPAVFLHTRIHTSR
jgi:hypothetical protein